ncbi:MAG: glycosyltransferase family 39 protein [Deltaproteobacteria bacterium]|nr:glycosyltransferase family 39 protein [Deltaproteobacteria bacterium]
MKKWQVVLGSVLLIAGLLALRRGIAVEPLDRLHQDGDSRTGSWYFPRGGPYILGFEADGPAELLIDGREVAAGSGEVKARVIFPPGPHAVVFRGPAASRLLWHPPGRRGAPEYVPPSSLSPDPPERARFGPDVGASWGDAAIATAILLVVLAVLGVLAWPISWRAAAPCLAVLALALAVRLVGLSAAGQTWDEDEYWSSGRNYLINLLSLDFRPSSWRWNYEHPPVTKYIAGLGALWQDGYGVARGLFALLGAGTSALVVAIGSRLLGARAGLLAGIFCALTPRLIAHDKVVGHEAPSVFFWTLAVWLGVRESSRKWSVAWVGVALGLAMATRFSNLLLAPLVGVVVFACAKRGERKRAMLRGAVLVPVTAGLTFVLSWPRMWSSPESNLHAAWRVLRRQHLPEQYLGEIIQRPDWHYFPAYLLATAPLGLLACAFLLGGWRAISRREKGWVLVVAWLLAPLGVVFSPVRQDGVRYVLPALVPLALMAGAGLCQAMSAMRPRAGWVLAAAAGLYMTVTCARIWPFYLDYYGEHVGGPRTVASRRWFEVGWWGEGIAAAIRYVNQHASPSDTVYRVLQPIHLNWLREDLWGDSRPDDADWIVENDLGKMAHALTGRGTFGVPDDARLVYEVTAQGASLVRVYRR